MGFLDRFFKKTEKDLQGLVHRQVNAAFNKVRSTRRQTLDTSAPSLFWYEGIISKGEFRSKTVMQNLKMIRDMNPDASMAVWNFLRLANNSHELEAVGPNGKPEKASTDLINSLAQRVGAIYGGGTDQLINVLLLTALTQGAVALEVELNEDLTDVVDFHAVDPSKLDYRRDKETGELELVQKQADGSYKVLNQEQVFYRPIDPDVDDPYGRSPILPVLQVVFFQMEILRDLKRAVHHQGWQRFDITVVEEAIMNNLPDEIKMAGPDEVSRYVSSYIQDIQDQMSHLEPDDDFFHTDSVQISTAGGGNNRGSMDVTGVIEVINQQVVTSLKQLPILLGRNDGTTETHGTVQWQIYVSGIESLQRAIKRLLERAYNVALDIYGKPRRAKLTFNSLRVNDRLKEAQAEEVETRVKISQYNQGWIDNDEAANEMVGHNAVDEPKQQQVPVNPNPPIEETAKESRIRNMPEKKFQGNREDDEVVDEFVSEIDESWADEVAGKTSRAAARFYRFLKDQRKEYISRLPDADEVPTRVLADVFSLRSIMDRKEIPEPTNEFEEWVRNYILYDSSTYRIMLEGITYELSEEMMLLTGESTFIDLDVDTDFNMQDGQLLRWLEKRSSREAELIQGVSDDKVIMNLWDLVYEGQYSIDKAAESLMNEFAFSENRARTIARTEIITAGRSGQYFADVQSGMVIGKKWMAAQQERTRDAHREADGQVVAIDEPFIVDGEELMFPGDNSRGASGKNCINCRCWYKRILEGEAMK
ncbi:phage minor head protein [Peribacillus frigoritolerans]|uniref:phage minor head protein n=1 Tax=Peribacillus frigoritolerans TaxID=450367 RepID=UPI0032B3992F